MSIIWRVGSLKIENNLKEHLEKLNIDTGDQHIYIVERGLEIPDNGLSVIIDKVNISMLSSLLDHFAEKKKSVCNDLVMGKKSDSLHPLSYKIICYFFAEGNTVYCKTEKEQYEINRKLYELEVDLLSKGFLRINKSVVVNMLWIAEIIPWFGGKLLLKIKNTRYELEVSRNYVVEFKEFLGI
jgi:two-component system, LytTR family, response regulator